MILTRTKLSPPWITYANKIRAMFEKDPEIDFKYDNDHIAVTLFVHNGLKADALAAILPMEKYFGNVCLSIYVESDVNTYDVDIPEDIKELFDTAFRGNPAYSFSKKVTILFDVPVLFVVFQPEVVQFFNDNLNDIYGNANMLYQDIAYDLFEVADSDNVYYCTDVRKGEQPRFDWLI